MGKLTAGVGFGAGYVLGTRAGRERYDQFKTAAVKISQRPEVQQATDRLKTVAGEKLQTPSGRVRRSATAVAGRLRPRAGRPVADATQPFPAGDATDSADGTPLS